MIVAVTMVKDEADVIGHTINHLLAEGVDHVVVADNLSSDATPDIIGAFPTSLVTVLEDNEVGHYQDRKMTALARIAGEMGAEWVLPFDADEVWYSEHGTIAGYLAECPHSVLLASGWDHLATDDDDPADENPYTRITQRRQGPQKLPKVAFRFNANAHIDHGNHDVFDHPGERARGLHYRHFQFRSFEQMTRKVRQGKEAFDATNLHPTYGSHWREMGALSDSDLWSRWRRLCEEPGLIEDPAPLR